MMRAYCGQQTDKETVTNWYKITSFSNFDPALRAYAHGAPSRLFARLPSLCGRDDGGSRLAAEFSHSLDAQIGGPLAAGFLLIGLYDDAWSSEITPLNRYIPMYLAARAMKAA